MRKLIRLTFVLATLSLVLPAMPVAAQLTGSRIGKNVRAKDIPALMRLMAECVVARRQGMVGDWLNTLPGSSEEARMLTKGLADLDVCIDHRELVMGHFSELIVSPKSVRLPLALALARKQLRKGTASPALAKGSDPWFVSKLAAVGDSTQIDRGHLALQDFGHCVALADWEGARMLILANPETPAEKAAVNQLRPVLGPCLDQNAKIQLTPANLRTALAEPMVHVMLASWGS